MAAPHPALFRQRNPVDLFPGHGLRFCSQHDSVAESASGDVALADLDSVRHVFRDYCRGDSSRRDPDGYP